MSVEEIVKSPANYDKIVDLQEQLEATTDVESLEELLLLLTAVYGRLAQKGEFTAGSNAKVRSWLDEQLNEFTGLVKTKADLVPALCGSVILKLALLNGKYRSTPISPLVQTLLEASFKNPLVLSSVFDDFVTYDDLRFALYKAVCETELTGDLTPLIQLLCACDKVVNTDNDIKKAYISSSYLEAVLPFAQKHAAKQYKQTFQKAWLAVLSSPQLTSSNVKEVLSVMHARVIPNMARPHLVMDFLVSAYEFGGAVSLLALNAVFVLIQKYELDYPDFFAKLYALLNDGSLLSSAHRARFLRLLDLCMTSTHLPAAIPASFMKRLARICLYAPPGAIISIVPFVYNLLKRHPMAMVLIHRPHSSLSAAEDPFNNSEPNPLATNALESSLWELSSLATHYHPNVAALARIMSQPFTKPQYALEHFLAHSYETLYMTERRRRRDKDPALEYEAYNVFDDTVFAL